MWYLRADTLALIAVLCVLIGLLPRLRIRSPRVTGIALLLMSGAVLLYISVDLAVLYAVYSLGVFVLTAALSRITRARAFFFVLFVALCTVPFLITRAFDLGLLPNSLITGIGMAFAMLKAIDALFYVYYTREHISPLNLVCYLTFIPTFTSGPIFRCRDFAKSLAEVKVVSAEDYSYGIRRVILGMFKKIVLAEMVMLLFNRLLALDGGILVSVGVIACSYFILFFDLSGYSDIAVGFGRICGFTVPENFKNPLTAPSFTLFWRNWHVTLSDWIREHVFILLANKRLKRWQSATVAFFTMIVMALWHGFNLPYLVAGAYNGALLAIENIASLTTFPKKRRRGAVFALRCFIVNFLFAINTLVFTCDWQKALDVVCGLFRP